MNTQNSVSQPGQPERKDTACPGAEQPCKAGELHLDDTGRLLEGLRLINEALSPAGIYAGMFKVMRCALRFEDAFILAPAGSSESQLTVIAATSDRFEQTVWTPGDSFRAVLDGRPLAAATQLTAEWKAQPESVRTGAVSALHIPLRSPGINAILVGTHSSPEFFTPDHCDQALRLSAFAVQALRNAYLVGDLQVERDVSRQRGRLESFVADISSRFINLKVEETDIAITEALKSVGRLTDVDRSYIFILDGNSTTMSNSHEWCADGITPEIANLQQIPCSLLPWWMDILMKFGTIHIPRVADLPPEASAEKAILQPQGIQSLLVVPIVWRQSLRGFLGFDSVRRERAWTGEDRRLLELMANTIAQTLERVRAEKQRVTMEIQLRHAQKMESIGQLAAGIAHEINTPTQFVGDNIRFMRDTYNGFHSLLHCLLGFYRSREPFVRDENIEQALLAADLPYIETEVPRAIEQSLEGIQRVANIVMAMKEFSHPNAEVMTPFDINRAIEITTTIARNEWKYVADLKLDLEPGLPPVTCLPGDFNQVMLNLIVNSAHAIGSVVSNKPDSRGLITVSTRQDGSWVEIRVTDTGCGIAEEHRSRVFEPFFTTKPIGKGTGQGLTIAYNVIVNKHKGTINFESTPGKGTVFIVRLPREGIPPA